MKKRIDYYMRNGDMVCEIDGEFAFVFDPEYLDLVQGKAWRLTGGRYYAYWSGKRNTYLHRMLLAAGDGELVDHINQDPKDNRVANLRITGWVENARNSKPYRNNTSGRKGVSKFRNKWKAYVCMNYKHIHLGVYDSFEEACKAREAGEIKYYGEVCKG